MHKYHPHIEHVHVRPEITCKHLLRKCTLCALMGIDFLQQTEARVQLSMMKWIWLINHSRNSITLYVALVQSPSLHSSLFFFLTRHPPNHLHLPWLCHYHPFSFLCSSSQLSKHSLHLLYFPLLTYILRTLRPLVPDLKRTPRQTVEQSDSRDQTFALNYNPSK